MPNIIARVCGENIAETLRSSEAVECEVMVIGVGGFLAVADQVDCWVVFRCCNSWI